ncbi:MAG: RIP metalloprotease RseP [Verrucomicrobiae bacterium]|nr:RIP metalloprotease RseP [Verrucomicrobiae bacterium]NNJ86421.1 RIP metalloprotease RseP [Akkermansiaceae bacterium]
MSILMPIFVIFVVIVIFNIIIFVHELGHFLAARWRGLEVERFQIWFGKPIWKKTYNGVQYGLGWIPFGGFVALPQMVTMEKIEGDNMTDKPLPPASPIDKIIVAFAGPLFSFLLAVVTAFAVWGVGKPSYKLNSTIVGYIDPDKPAAKAKPAFQEGDKIIAVNGIKVDRWRGDTDTGVSENIMLSEGKTIEFTVEREGSPEPIIVKSGYHIPDTPWYDRRAMRQVGIMMGFRTLVGKVIENSPAAEAGVKEGDEILSVNGKKAYTFQHIVDAQETGDPATLEIKRGDETLTLSLSGRLPKSPKDSKPNFGILPAPDPTLVTATTEYPTPWAQIKHSAAIMYTTITKVISRHSDVGVQHLAGPIGIGKGYYQMLTAPDGWKLALGFTVLFNINLAILNMLPFPVLDGGHITLSILEIIARRPVHPKILEVVQTAFVLLIFGLFIFITSKDIGSSFVGEDEQKIPVFEKVSAPPG